MNTEEIKETGKACLAGAFVMGVVYYGKYAFVEIILFGIL